MLHLGALAPSPPEVPDWPARLAALAATARDPRLRAFYAAGTPAGDTPFSEVPLVALDVETTGLDPARDEIVSLGLVPMHGGRIQAGASRHWIVRPRRALAAASVALHGITHAQVETAPDLEAVLADCLDAISHRVVVAHCAPIERGFLAAALRERIGEPIEFPVIDTMALEARVHRRRPSGLPRLLARWLGRRPESIRLADARDRFGLPRYRPHHAPTDALAAAELLQAQIAHRFAPDTPLRALWG